MSNCNATIDQIIREYKECKSVREVARRYQISEQAVKKMLISNGIYPSAKSKQIAEMLEAGKSYEEIIEKNNIKTLSMFLPYSRGPYAIGEKSLNAKRIKAWREKTKSIINND